MSSFIVQALLNRDITVFGEGLQTRSFCYVNDMVDGLIKLMDSSANAGPIHLGNPDEFTILELAEMVIALPGSESKIVHRPLPEDDPRRRSPDISEAQRVLAWRSTVNLEEGLRSTSHISKRSYRRASSRGL